MDKFYRPLHGQQWPACGPRALSGDIANRRGECGWIGCRTKRARMAAEHLVDIFPKETSVAQCHGVDTEAGTSPPGPEADAEEAVPSDHRHVGPALCGTYDHELKVFYRAIVFPTERDDEVHAPIGQDDVHTIG